jgi:hypothetical protein
MPFFLANSLDISTNSSSSTSNLLEDIKVFELIPMGEGGINDS